VVTAGTGTGRWHQALAPGTGTRLWHRALALGRFNECRTSSWHRFLNHKNKKQRLARATHSLHVRSFHSASLQTVLSSDCLCGTPEFFLPHTFSTRAHSFQLRAYEQGTRIRSTQADDDLHALRRERDDALRDLNASKDQSRV
jgi:hypothetical protein